MEQALLDSSKYKIYSMSMDSRFADQYNLCPGDTSDFTIRLPSTYRNIARIALSSVELPLVEMTFSVKKGNISFLVTDPSDTATYVTVAIAEGNYTSPDLADAVEDALKALHPGFSATVDPFTGTITISHATTAFTIIPTSPDSLIAARPSHWGLGYYLGFRSKGPLTATGTAPGPYTLTATAPVLTQPTPYYLLQLWCPDLAENLSHRLSAGAFLPAFAKLVLRDGYYSLQFVDNSDYLRKEFTFLSPTNISHLRVKLLDPYGEPVDLRGMEWSTTFELYEVVNSRTYTTMMGTYGRA